MTVLTPELFYLTADELLDCVCEALTEESACGCPCRTFVAAGTPAWDDCCEGQLTAWVENVWYHENFPSRMSTAAICNSVLAGDLVVQLLRCAPTVTDGGAVPTGPELDASSRQIYSDMYIAVKAIACCLQEAGKNRLYVIRDTKIVGPNGGCVGWEIRLTIQLSDPMPGTI